MKFAATIWSFYNFQVQKRIVSAETIWGNTVSLYYLDRNMHKTVIASLFWVAEFKDLIEIMKSNYAMNALVFLIKFQ